MEKNRKEITLTIKKSDWGEIKKLISKADSLIEDNNDIHFESKKYTRLYNYFNDLRRKLEEVGKNQAQQETKTKLGEIYEQGFRNGISFVNYTWLFDYGEQEEYLVRNGEMKKNYGELWDRDIDREIKKSVKSIK